MKREDVKEIFARPLSAEAFAPLATWSKRRRSPAAPISRRASSNLRARRAAEAVDADQVAGRDRLPLEFDSLERHEFSSQSFVPIDIGTLARRGRAACAAMAGRLIARVQAFLAQSDAGRRAIEPNVWHGSLDRLRAKART